MKDSSPISLSLYTQCLARSFLSRSLPSSRSVPGHYGPVSAIYSLLSSSAATMQVSLSLL